jgi:hypothetical protein
MALYQWAKPTTACSPGPTKGPASPGLLSHDQKRGSHPLGVPAAARPIPAGQQRVTVGNETGTKLCRRGANLGGGEERARGKEALHSGILKQRRTGDGGADEWSVAPAVWSASIKEPGQSLWQQRWGRRGGAERAVRAEVLMEDGNGGEVLGHSACAKRTEGGTQGGCSGGSSMVAGAS